MRSSAVGTSFIRLLHVPVRKANEPLHSRTPHAQVIPPRLVTNGSVSWSGGTLLEFKIDTVGGAPPPLGEVVFSPVARAKRRGFGGGEDEAEKEVVSLAQLLPWSV